MAVPWKLERTFKKFRQSRNNDPPFNINSCILNFPAVCTTQWYIYMPHMTSYCTCLLYMIDMLEEQRQIAWFCSITTDLSRNQMI